MTSRAFGAMHGAIYSVIAAAILILVLGTSFEVFTLWTAFLVLDLVSCATFAAIVTRANT